MQTVRISQRWLRLQDTRREKGTSRLIRDPGRHTKGSGSSKAAPAGRGKATGANTHSSRSFNGCNSLLSYPDLAHRSAPTNLPGAAPGAGNSRMQSEVQTECVRGGAQGFGELLSTYMASECEQRGDKAVDQTFLRRQEEFTRLMEWNCKWSLAWPSKLMTFQHVFPKALAVRAVIHSHRMNGNLAHASSLLTRSPRIAIIPIPVHRLKTDPSPAMTSLCQCNYSLQAPPGRLRRAPRVAR